MRRSFVGFLVGVIVVASISFAWGFFCNRNNIFPYPVIRSLGLSLGMNFDASLLESAVDAVLEAPAEEGEAAEAEAEPAETAK